MSDATELLHATATTDTMEATDTREVIDVIQVLTQTRQKG